MSLIVLYFQMETSMEPTDYKENKENRSLAGFTNVKNIVC